MLQQRCLFYPAITRDNPKLTLKLTLYFTAINRGATIALLQSRCIFYPAITRDNPTVFHRDKSRCYNGGATMAVFILPCDNSRKSHTQTQTHTAFQRDKSRCYNVVVTIAMFILPCNNSRQFHIQTRNSHSHSNCLSFPKKQFSKKNLTFVS